MGQDISRPRNRAEFPNVLLFVHLIRSDDVVAELVVEIDQGWNDGIGPNRARRSRRTRICGRDVIAVLDARDRSGERRVGIAIQPASIRSRHRQRRGIDRQLAIIRSDDVVAELVIGIDQGWNDGIRSHWACGSRRTSICGGDVVGVLDPGDRARESRIGIAVETVGVRSRHRQWRGIDGQLAIV